METFFRYWPMVVISIVLMAIARWVFARWYLNRLAKKLADDPGRRGLFCFHDGAKVRSVDPISVLMEMEAHEHYRFDLTPLRVARGEREAVEITVDAVRKAFGVAEYTKPGTAGLTVQETLQLFNAFCRYLDLQKKSISATPTSQVFTGAETSEPSNPQTTSDTSGSGSTDLEQTPNEPKP